MITAAVLASGFSERFGGQKLTALLGGKPLVSYVLEALSGLPVRRLLVTGNDAVAEIARIHGAEVIFNPDARLGQSMSVRLAARAADGSDGLLLLTGDMPFIQSDSLRRMLEAFETGRADLICLQSDDHFGNPALFGKGYFPELRELSGDRGARRILLSHEASLLKLPCSYPYELTDVDTPEQLDACERHLAAQ